MKAALRVPALIVALSPAALAVADVVPLADHHQHLFSPAIAERLSTPERALPTVSVSKLKS